MNSNPPSTANNNKAEVRCEGFTALARLLARQAASEFIAQPPTDVTDLPSLPDKDESDDH